MYYAMIVNCVSVFANVQKILVLFVLSTFIKKVISENVSACDGYSIYTKYRLINPSIDSIMWQLHEDVNYTFHNKK
jgi:hypothetical protein